jgi:hypothetical protein
VDAEYKHGQSSLHNRTGWRQGGCLGGSSLMLKLASHENAGWMWGSVHGDSGVRMGGGVDF